MGAQFSLSSFGVDKDGFKLADPCRYARQKILQTRQSVVRHVCTGVGGGVVWKRDVTRRWPRLRMGGMKYEAGRK